MNDRTTDLAARVVELQKCIDDGEAMLKALKTELAVCQNNLIDAFDIAGITNMTIDGRRLELYHDTYPHVRAMPAFCAALIDTPHQHLVKPYIFPQVTRAAVKEVEAAGLDMPAYFADHLDLSYAVKMRVKRV